MCFLLSLSSSVWVFLQLNLNCLFCDLTKCMESKSTKNPISSLTWTLHSQNVAALLFSRCMQMIQNKLEHNCNKPICSVLVVCNFFDNLTRAVGQFHHIHPCMFVHTGVCPLWPIGSCQCWFVLVGATSSTIVISQKNQPRKTNFSSICDLALFFVFLQDHWRTQSSIWHLQHAIPKQPSEIDVVISRWQKCVWVGWVMLNLDLSKERRLFKFKQGYRSFLFDWPKTEWIIYVLWILVDATNAKTWSRGGTRTTAGLKCCTVTPVVISFK